MSDGKTQPTGPAWALVGDLGWRLRQQSQHDRWLIHVAQHRAGKASRSGVLFVGLWLLVFLLFFGGLHWYLPRSTHPVTEADISSGISPELRSLIQDTFSPDARRRADAAERLGDLRERAAPAAPFVIRLLKDDASLDEETTVAAIACSAVAKIGAPAIDLLVAQLSDPVGPVRSLAVYGLSCSSDPRIVMPLIGRFRDADPHVRSGAVHHFRKHRDLRVVQPLLNMAKNGDDKVRQTAIYALGEQRDPRVVPELLTILRRADDSCRSEAAVALGMIGDRAGLEALVATLNDRREVPLLRMSVAGALGKAPDCGPAAVESLTRILQQQGEIPALRGTAAKVLAAIQGTKVAPLLSEIARTPSENDQVRFWAAISVVGIVEGAIDDPLFLAPLGNGYVDLQMREHLSQLAQRRKDTENALAKVAKQGKTPAIRAEASRILDETR